MFIALFIHSSVKNLPLAFKFLKYFFPIYKFSKQNYNKHL